MTELTEWESINLERNIADDEYCVKVLTEKTRRRRRRRRVAIWRELREEREEKKGGDC